MTLPQGWYPHPQNPAYAYNDRGEVRPIAELAQPAPPAYAQPAAPAAQPAAYEQPWGEQDPDMAERAMAEKSYREGGVLWLSFPELTGHSEVSMLMRLFPPWRRDLQKSWLDVKRHRVPARFVPDIAADREVWFLDCPTTPDVGGQPCPLCAALDAASQTAHGKAFSEMRARMNHLWQGLVLTNIQAHQQLVRDPRTGLESPGIVPGVLRAGPQLHEQIIYCGRARNKDRNIGHFTHPDIGFPIELIKRKGKHEKKGAMNVEYAAQHQAHLAGPIDPSLYSALHHVIDLRERCVHIDLQRLEAVAQAVRAEAGRAVAAPPAYGMPGGYAAAPLPVYPTAPAYAPAPAYPAQVYPPAPAYPAQVYPPAPAYPAAPPAAPAPAYPAAPPAAPPMAAAPPAPPGLPPPTAPGLPPGAMPAVPPPPEPGRMPPMPPAQLEASFGPPGTAPALPQLPALPAAPPAAPPAPAKPPF